MRFIASLLASSLIFLATFAAAETAAHYTDRWGLPIGSSIPPLEAADQHGEVRNFESLKGKNGLLLFMNRSADW
ncbi:MAG: hypothetical protein ACU84Q_06440 [Gammaproteobacteria bacterium]